MSDRVPCEFFLIRYVPNVVRGEFVNIGVILRQVREDGSKADDVIVRFTRDWARVRCLDPDADIELLESLEAEFANRLVEDLVAFPAVTDDLNDFLADVEERFLEQYAVTRVLAEFSNTLSNSIQMTEPHASLARSMPEEVEKLMQMYVESA